MTIEVLVPKLGFATSDGVVAEWLVNNGVHVTEGQPIYNLESDKSVNEVESPGTGIITILVEPGTTCAVGTVVATIV